MNFFQTIVQHLFESTIVSVYPIKMTTFLSNFDFKQFDHYFDLHSNDDHIIWFSDLIKYEKRS